MSVRKKLGQILLEAGVLDEYQLKSALGYQRQWGGRLGDVLLKNRFVSEEALFKALHIQLGIPLIDLQQMEIPEALLRLLPVELVEKHQLLPIKMVKEPGKSQPTIFVATSDPPNLQGLEAVRFKTGKQASAVLATPSAIRKAIRKYYRGEKQEEIFEDANFGQATGIDELQLGSEVHLEEGGSDETLLPPLRPLERETEAPLRAPVHDIWSLSERVTSEAVLDPEDGLSGGADEASLAAQKKGEEDPFSDLDSLLTPSEASQREAARPRPSPPPIQTTQWNDRFLEDELPEVEIMEDVPAEPVPLPAEPAPRASQPYAASLSEDQTLWKDPFMAFEPEAPSLTPSSVGLPDPMHPQGVSVGPATRRVRPGVSGAPVSPAVFGKEVAKPPPVSAAAAGPAAGLLDLLAGTSPEAYLKDMEDLLETLESTEIDPEPPQMMKSSNLIAAVIRLLLRKEVISDAELLDELKRH